MRNDESPTIRLVILIAVITLIGGWFWSLNQDEGVFLTIANEMRHGAIPYRDFFDHKPPGIYFLLAFLTDIFHLSALGVRIGIFIVNFLTAGIIFSLGKMIWSKEVGLKAASLFLFTLPVYEGFLILTEPLMTFWMVLALWSYVKAQQERKYQWLIIAGLAAGTAVIFKQPAIFGVMVLAVVISINRLKGLVLYLIGLAIAWTPWIIFLVVRDVGEIAWQQVFTLNWYYPPSGVGLVVGRWLVPMLISLPVWVLFINKLWKLRIIRGEIENLLIFLSLVPMPLLLYRHYPHYALQILPFVALLAAKGWAEVDNGRRRKIIGLGVVFFALLSLGIFTILTIRQMPLKKEQILISQEIKANTSGDEYIYASRFFTAIYFLANRRPASNYLYLNELTDSLGGEKKQERDLLSKRPKYIVWNLRQPVWVDYYSQGVREIIETKYRRQSNYETLNLELYRLNE